jgi:type IV pilus assembly protein PilQ
MLAVSIKKDDVLDITAEEPPISTNSATTELLLEDGETIVIGGIIKARSPKVNPVFPDCENSGVGAAL